MKKHLYKAWAVIAALLLTTSCTDENTSGGNGDSGKTPLVLSSVAVTTTPDAQGAALTGTRTTDATTGAFSWATNDIVKVTATPTIDGEEMGLSTYSAIYIYTQTGNATGSWAVATGTGYEGNTPIYREDVDGAGMYHFTVETWGGKAAPTGTADADGVAQTVNDQSAAEAYILSDYIHGTALLNDKEGTLRADNTQSSHSLQHRTVDVVITIKPGNGWTSTDDTAGNAAFIAYMQAVAADKGFKLYADGDYRVTPLVYVNEDATVTLRAHIPAASLAGSNGGANTPLFSLVPQVSEGQTTLKTVFGAYTRPAEMTDGKRLTVSMTYSHLKGLSDVTATLGGWTPVGDLPDFNGGFHSISGYDVVILTPEDLATFAAAVNTGADIYSQDKGKNMKAYKAQVLQPVDLDLSQLKASEKGRYKATAANWIPIGNEQYPFIGAYNGNGHTISGMQITTLTQTGYAGLFGLIGNRTTTAVLRDICLDKARMELTTSLSTNNTGLLAGGVDNGSVSRCSATGNIHINSATTVMLGGLIGVFNGDNSYATLCRATVKISGSSTAATTSSHGIFAGGLVGRNSGKLFACSATGISIVLDGATLCAGGVVGENAGSNSLVFASYATTDIRLTAGQKKLYAGGLAGTNYGTLDSSYATGMATVSASQGGTAYAGAICAYNESDSKDVDNCYGAGRTSTVIDNVADPRTDGMGTSNLAAKPTLVYADGGAPAAGSIYKIVNSNMSYDNVTYLFDNGNVIQQTSKWYATEIWMNEEIPTVNEDYKGRAISN